METFVLERPVTMRADQLATTLRRAGLGEPHATLSLPSVWRDADAQRAADSAAWQACVRLGLTDGRCLRHDVVAALAVLVAPLVEFAGWFTVRGQHSAALAAAIGEEAVLAVRRGEQVSLRTVDAGRLADSLAGRMPWAKPGAGRPTTVHLARMRAELGVHHDVGGLTHPGVTTEYDQDIALLARLAGPDVHGFGELHVATREPGSRRGHAAPHPIRYVDSATGRWLVVTAPGGDEDWLDVRPADRPAVLTALRRAHDALTAPRDPDRLPGLDSWHS
jgi:hypothetical protein